MLRNCLPPLYLCLIARLALALIVLAALACSDESGTDSEADSANAADIGVDVGQSLDVPPADTATPPDTSPPDTTTADTSSSDTPPTDVEPTPDTSNPDMSSSDTALPDVEPTPDTSPPDTTPADVEPTPDTSSPDVEPTPDTSISDTSPPDTGPIAVCGDAVLNALDNEACDDGNTLDGDGCSAACAIEPQCTEGCLKTADCAPNELCMGKPKQVPDATGQCAPKGNPPGVGQACGKSTPCPAGLACLGEFMWADGQGFCIPGWQAKDFYSYDNVAIPDGGAAISSSVVACGLATVPVDIVVTLQLAHPRPEDLLVVLEDPNQQQGTVLDHKDYSGGGIVTYVGSGDDAVNGQWTLYVTDTVAGESGLLLGWSVYLLSNFD